MSHVYWPETTNHRVQQTSPNHDTQWITSSRARIIRRGGGGGVAEDVALDNSNLKVNASYAFWTL